MAPIHVRILEVFPSHEPSLRPRLADFGFEDEDEHEDDLVHGPNVPRNGGPGSRNLAAVATATSGRP